MTPNTPTLDNAVRLYEMLGKHIPDVPNEQVLDYVDAILENIKNSENPDDYFNALELMTDKRYDELIQLSPVEVLEIFVRALIEWHIVELVTFFRNIGYRT